MKTRNKALLTVLCAILLVVVSVMGTLAYLTDDDSVVNTFTVGKVELILDETDVKTDGTKDTNERVKENEYHLIPGHTYIKDPTVTVKADSEDCYVRMFVEVKNLNQLTEVLTAEEYYGAYGNGKVFLLQTLCVDEEGNLTWDADKWAFAGYTEATAEGGAVTGTYEFRYVETADDKVAKADTDTVLPALFTDITLPGAPFDNEEMVGLETVKINVYAQAIQADGFDTAAKAWAEWN
ncbi:MAG: hypothetical protein E7218_03410 [Anaerofustis stercorihominis]|nr:hypothetical protein [Anaerofustis stercorihominis]